MGGACSTYGEQKRSMQGFNGGDVRQRDHLVDPGGDGMIILRWISKDWDWEAWTGLIWLRMRAGGGRS